MGVETELIVASKEKASEICAANLPSFHFDNAQNFKGLDMVMLGTLYAILTDTEYDGDLISEFECLHEQSEAGPWVYFVPEKIVNAISNLDDGRVEAVIAKWEETEEISSGIWQYASDDVVEDSLGHLRRLSKISVDTSTPILMWMGM